MPIKRSIQLALILYVLGIIGFYFFQGLEPALWFGIGGGIGLLNFAIAGFVISMGLEKLRSRPLFLGLILFKSSAFVLMVALVLSFTKPQLLPFTSGISLVIFALIIWAIVNSRQHLTKMLDH